MALSRGYLHTTSYTGFAAGPSAWQRNRSKIANLFRPRLNHNPPAPGLHTPDEPGAFPLLKVPPFK